jgi:hypothetical protein
MRIHASVSTEAVAGAAIAMRIMMFTLMRGAWPTPRPRPPCLGRRKSQRAASPKVGSNIVSWRLIGA